MLVRRKIPADEITVKRKGSKQQIWPYFAYQQNNCISEDFTKNQGNRLSIERSQCAQKNSDTDINTVESFHCAIGPILNIAQWFGVFPVSGVRKCSPSKLRFKAFSFLTLYSIFIGLTVLFMAILSIIYALKTLNSNTFRMRGDIGAATAGAVFYGNGLFGSILFFRLSLRWTHLQCEWRAIERRIDRKATEIPRLRWKFVLISTTVLLLALIEHILSMFNNIDGYDWSDSNSTLKKALEMSSLRSHFFIFDTLDYNFTFGLYTFLVSKLATFTWNFTDLFIMLIATGLAERYSCLNKRLVNKVTKQKSTFAWSELREYYAIVSCLVKKVDSHISSIVFLSFANNLYFICLQLFNGLSLPQEKSLLSTVYFFGSFAFLIGRTCAVTLLAARINDQSKKALPYLYDCTASSYGIEVQRLQHQLATDNVVFTGLRFFSITRNFMLAVAGSIMTYEVVLLQFTKHI